MKTALSAAILALTATAAMSETINLDSPMAGATLKEGPSDISVYWTEEGDILAVTAIYVTDETPAQPSRLRMDLRDGDRVSFGLPGQRERLYSFVRDGETVRVENARVGIEFASR